ncbi:MAG: TIGR01777 family oxidoreductase [Acidobacteria bacterium]|nr:TIGR01777 family oxidoreductase [Acidobacteriota bacterium]
MKILITGAGGLIGTELQTVYRGHDLLLATRGEARKPEQITWSAEDGFKPEDLERLEGLDAVIHLAGEGISGLRWTDDKKAAIRDSRVKGTKALVNDLFKLEKRPTVLVSMSGIDFYGDTDDEVKTETDKAGDTFLAEVCKGWEAEARRAEDAGIRTVILRTAMVLSSKGGALATMLTPFKFGVGGVVGSGKQWMCWITLDDIVRVIAFAVDNNELRGAVNATSPNPVTNEEFTKTLGEVIYRPTFLPLPEFAVNLALGEMGQTLLLESRRAIPKRLTDIGFEFKLPTLKEALEHVTK